MQADRRWATGAIYDPRNLRLSDLEAALRKIVEKCNSDASHATLATIRMIAEAALGADDRSLNLGAGGQDLSGPTEAPIITAPAPSLNSDGRGHIHSGAESALVEGARPSEPQRDGEGQNRGAAQAGQVFPASPSRPTPRPIDPMFREALLAEKKETARIVRFFTHDGRDIMNLRMRELPEYRRVGAKQAAICDQILKHAANASAHLPVREVITAAKLEEFINDTNEKLRHANV